MSSENHPESHCDDCGRPNVNWHVSSLRWNDATGYTNPILCPVCFVRRWEHATGLRASWGLEPKTIKPITDAAFYFAEAEDERNELDYYGDNLRRLFEVLSYARECAEAEGNTEILVHVSRIESKNPIKAAKREGDDGGR